MNLNPFKKLRDKRRHEAPPKSVASAWRPPAAPTIQESPREKFLRERRHRRRAANRTRNAVAKQSRKVNRYLASAKD